MLFEHDPAVSEYQHDKFRPREAEALHLLRKIASLVKPIMRQRGWKVGILAEFWPTEQSLLGLNWNRGQKICLRLRHPGDQSQFPPIDELTDTMLHELCHIVHGPHHEAFHQLWNTLRDEHETLLRKGYTGEGFLSKGHKLGGGQRIPMHEAHRRARAAAEKRRTLTAGSGQKLGGAALTRGQDARKVIADAASRRMTVTKGCASETSAERSRELVKETNEKGTRTKADEDDANEEAIMLAYIDLVQEEEKEKYGDNYIRPSKENPAGSQGAPTKITSEPGPARASIAPPLPASTKPTSALRVRSQPPPPPPPTTPSNGSWTCEICTLVNPSTYLYCDACTTERPSPPSSPAAAPKSQRPPPSTRSTSSSIRDSNPKKAIRSLVSLDQKTSQQPKKPMGWLCHHCGNWMENEWWTCARCESMKLSS